MRGDVEAIDKEQPLYKMRTMTQLVDESDARRRFNMLLLGVFAAIDAGAGERWASTASSAYSVTQRTREIGIRIAFGAQIGDIIKMVLRQGMALALVGLAAGLVGAFS